MPSIQLARRVAVCLWLSAAMFLGCGEGGVGGEAPVITSQPASQSVGVGQSATFEVTATGSAPLSYQWTKDGLSIPGATSASHTTPDAQPADHGASYRVVVRNSAGSATSEEAVLLVRGGSFSQEPEFEEDFDAPLDPGRWQVASWVEHGGQTGPERCYAQDGLLHMIFVNDSTAGYLSAALQTRSTFLYGRWEARLKPSSVPGVLNSLYTIDWGDGSGTKQEIDIEFLTFAFGENSGKVHFAVHAEGRESSDTNPDIELGFNPSDDFHVYGFEITPEQIRWFADERVLWTYTYSGNPITIDSPYQLKLNVWSAQHWIQGPPEADTPCVYLIDWIRFYPFVE
jgi:hypothetical protein